LEHTPIEIKKRIINCRQGKLIREKLANHAEKIKMQKNIMKDWQSLNGGIDRRGFGERAGICIIMMGN